MVYATLRSRVNAGEELKLTFVLMNKLSKEVEGLIEHLQNVQIQRKVRTGKRTPGGCCCYHTNMHEARKEWNSLLSEKKKLVSVKDLYNKKKRELGQKNSELKNKISLQRVLNWIKSEYNSI